VKVRFSQMEEFQAELLKRPANVEPVVRATYRRIRQEYGNEHLYVIAGYLRQPQPDLPPHLVELMEYQGELWGGLAANRGPADREVVEKAEQRRHELERFVDNFRDEPPVMEDGRLFRVLSVGDGVYWESEK
jgi:hypothetical protein